MNDRFVDDSEHVLIKRPYRVTTAAFCLGCDAT